MTNKEAIEFLKNMIDTQSVGAVLPNGEKALWQYHIEALNMAISALQPHWIPVAERLPEDDVEVIVSCTDDSGDTSFSFTTVAWHFKGTWVCNNERCFFVTAWMPLPDPWKGEKDED